MKRVTNIKDVREVLSEAAETAWIDKTYLNRATLVVNAMGKIISSVAVELKAAELSKREPNIDFLK